MIAARRNGMEGGEEDGLEEQAKMEQREGISEFETARVRRNQPTETSLGEDLIELGSTGNSTTYTVQGTSG